MIRGTHPTSIVSPARPSPLQKRVHDNLKTRLVGGLQRMLQMLQQTPTPFGTVRIRSTTIVVATAANGIGIFLLGTSIYYFGGIGKRRVDAAAAARLRGSTSSSKWDAIFLRSSGFQHSQHIPMIGFHDNISVVVVVVVAYGIAFLRGRCPHCVPTMTRSRHHCTTTPSRMQHGSERGGY